MNTNVFENPLPYLEQIKDFIRIPNEYLKQFTGKSIASVFPTKFCDAGCPHCFFRSGKQQYGLPQEQYELSDEGLEKFITFINQSNNGYLLVIGGGEPFKKFDQVKEIVKRVKTDKLVLVTSGFWAKDYEQAKKMIFELYECYQQRRDNAKVILRLSIDTWHARQLGQELIHHVISIFQEFFSKEENFELVLHTLVGDSLVDEIVEKRGDCTLTPNPTNSSILDQKVLKVSPNTATLTFFASNYSIIVGYSRRFYSNLKQNIKIASPLLKKAVQIFKEDMKYSAFDNPSIIPNSDGSYGLNLWINYNGNVSSWINQQTYDLCNIYTNSYEEFIQKSFGNIVSYSFLDKGYTYRNRIIAEVNKQAVIRSQAINIRDYAGAAILEEYHTILYYAIRVIQDYMKEKKLKMDDILPLPLELIHALYTTKRELIKQYQNSNYSIVQQYMDKLEFNETDWKDLFNLIYMGHYAVTKEQLNQAIEFYNAHASLKIRDIEDVLEQSNQHYDRLNERLTFMQEQAKQWCLSHADSTKSNTVSAG